MIKKKKKFTLTPGFALSHANISHNCLFFCLTLFEPMQMKYISVWKEPSVSNLYSHPNTFSLLLFLFLKNTKWTVSLLVVSVCDPVGCSPPSSSVHGILQAIILEWAAIRFSWGSSWLRDQIWVPYIAGRFFTIWATREALKYYSIELWFNGEIICRVIWIFKVFILPPCQKNKANHVKNCDFLWVESFQTYKAAMVPFPYLHGEKVWCTIWP